MVSAPVDRQNRVSPYRGGREAGPVCESVSAADCTPGMNGSYASPFPPASSQLQALQKTAVVDPQVNAMALTVQALLQLHQSPAGDSVRPATGLMVGAAVSSHLRTRFC